MRATRFALAILVTIAAAGSSLVLTGCGNRNLVLKVDMLSYLDPAVTNARFGPVPPLPEGLFTGEQLLVKDALVNLLDNADALAGIKSMTMSMQVTVDDSTGSGADTMRVYLSDPSIDPLTTAPALVMPVLLNPGQTEVTDADLGGDQRLVDLFKNRQMRMTISTALRGPSTGSEALNASVRVSKLGAIIIVGRKSM